MTIPVITNKQHMPQCIHFAALLFTSVNVPLNDREKNDPDQGYEYKSKSIVEYIVFKSKAEMETWINLPDNKSNTGSYQILEVNPLMVRVTASIIG